MKLSVLGLGYIRVVSAGCLAREVDLINAGRTPVIEKEIGEIIEKQGAAGRCNT